MSDVKDMLDRMADRDAMPEPAFDRLRRRHDRRLRSHRIVAAVVAIAVAGAAFAGALTLYRSTGIRPASGRTIAPSDLSKLHLSWTGWTNAGSGGLKTQPIVAGNDVYVTADHLYAFDASCRLGGEPCRPHFVGTTTGDLRQVGTILFAGTDAYDLACVSPPCGPTGQPNWVGAGMNRHADLQSVAAVEVEGDRFTAYGINGDGRLESTYCEGDAEQGGMPCGVRWIADVTPPQPLPPNYGCGGCIRGPIVADGMVFVSSNSLDGPGRLFAFASDCVGGWKRPCAPLWTADGPSLGTPVIADGFVDVSGGDGRLYAFDEGCSGTCVPSWHSKPLGRYLGTPTVAGDQLVVATDSGGLYAFDSPQPECHGSGTLVCFPTWQADLDDSGPRSLAVTGGKVIVGTEQRLWVFPQDCSEPCAPSWTGPRGATIAAVRDGVVYTSDGGHGIDAYPLDCRNDGGSCTPSWEVTTRSLVRTIAVGAGGVFAGTGDGTLLAYRTEPATPNGGRDPGSSWFALVVGATLGAGFWAGRRWSR